MSHLLHVLPKYCTSPRAALANPLSLSLPQTRTHTRRTAKAPECCADCLPCIRTHCEALILLPVGCLWARVLVLILVSPLPDSPNKNQDPQIVSYVAGCAVKGVVFASGNHLPRRPNFKILPQATNTKTHRSCLRSRGVLLWVWPVFLGISPAPLQIPTSLPRHPQRKARTS